MFLYSCPGRPCMVGNSGYNKTGCSRTHSASLNILKHTLQLCISLEYYENLSCVVVAREAIKSALSWRLKETLDSFGRKGLWPQNKQWNNIYAVLSSTVQTSSVILSTFYTYLYVLFGPYHWHMVIRLVLHRIVLYTLISYHKISYTSLHRTTCIRSSELSYIISHLFILYCIAQYCIALTLASPVVSCET